jgi:hypothetical protein
MVHVKLYGILLYKTTNPTVEKCIVLETAMANYVAMFGSGDAAMVLPWKVLHSLSSVKSQIVKRYCECSRNDKGW